MNQRDSDLLKGIIAGALVGNAASGQASPPNADTGTQKGCLGCFAVVVVLAMIGAVLDKFGCVASEQNLREGVDVSLNGTTLQPEKKLAWVDFTISNRSKWSVSMLVECQVFNTTNPSPVFSNSLEVRNVKPRSDTQHRLAIDLEELARNGISDPTDTDRCRIQLTSRWISKAGEERSNR